MIASLEVVQGFINTWGGKITGATIDWVTLECPFAGALHSKGTDTDPSFGIRIGGKGEFNCFSCGTKGRTLHNLAQRLVSENGSDGWDFETALSIGASTVQDSDGQMLPPLKVETPVKLDHVFSAEEEAHFLGTYDSLMLPTSAIARNYLESRGVVSQYASDLGVLYNPKWNRLIFPLRDMYGQLSGVQSRALSPDPDEAKYLFLSYKGIINSNMMYGLDIASKMPNPNKIALPAHAPTLCVEGVMDWYALNEIHASRCIAFLGTLSKQKLNILNWFRPLAHLADNDEAGIAKGQILKAAFPETRLYKCPLPGQDPSSFHLENVDLFDKSINAIYAGKGT
jgi:hypothetical protein